MNTQKVVLVTGGAKRIGAGIVQICHQQGYNVIVHFHHSAKEADDLCTQLNQERAHSAIALKQDLNDCDAFPALIADALAIWGRLDALVNNASTFFPTPLSSVTSSDWDKLMGPNVKAPYFLSLAAREALQANRGCIVNICDHHIQRPFRDHSVYCISKSALIMLTKSLAKELAPNIRVNGVAPGIILWPEPEPSDSVKAQLVAETALGRKGDKSDIAGAVLFLMANADYITGEVIKVDGGRSLNW